MSSLSLALLGPFDAWLNGAPLHTFRSNRVQALLIYLAVAADQSHRREAVMELLWPGLPPHAAQVNLRQTLYQLRKLIPALPSRHDNEVVPFVLADRQSIQVNPDCTYDLDVATFTKLLAGAPAEVERAIALYRGDFLTDFYLPDSDSFEAWAASQRAAYRRQVLDALDTVTDAYLEQGAYDKAERYARRQLELDNLREGAHRQLMTSLAHGGQRSAALRQYESCVALLDEELGAPPETETIQLYEAIQANQLAPFTEGSSSAPALRSSFPSAERLNNLPVPRTPFIGREQERAAVATLLRARSCRLLTLTGPGGTGKTRLAIQVANDLLNEFPAGVCWVDLAALRDPGLVAPTILQALGLPQQADQEAAVQVQEALRIRPGLLLLFDNFEHILAAAPLISDLISVPELKILATSREPLHLYGEQEFAVPPLTVPQLSPSEAGNLLARLSPNEAVRLFVARARAVRADFQLTEDNVRAVAAVCRRLDGLPLAIELAAARSKLFSPDALLALLSDQAEDSSLRILKSPARDLPARQQTLYDVIDWSYQLLTPSEQQLFARLSVFVGGCTVDAAENICRGVDEQEDVLAGIESLLDKSLLQRLDAVAGEPRVGMLETVREYAAGWLEACGEVAAMRDHHLAYYLRLAERAEEGVRGPQQVVWLARVGVAHPNLRKALGWALADEKRSEAALHLAGSLFWFWWRHGYWAEGRDWLLRALAAHGDVAVPVRRKALFAAAAIAFFRGRYDDAEELATECLALSQQAGDQRGQAGAYFHLGNVAGVRGDAERAATFIQEGLALARQNYAQQQRAWDRTLLYWFLMTEGGRQAFRHGEYVRGRVLFQEGLVLARAGQDNFAAAGFSMNLGRIAYYEGKYQQAEEWLQASLGVYGQQMDTVLSVFALLYLGRIAYHNGQYERAAIYLRESLRFAWDTMNREQIADVLVTWASLAVRQEKSKRAARLLGATQALLDAIGLVLEVGHRLDYERLVGDVRTRLDEETFAAAWAEGQSMTLEEAVAYALEGDR